MVTMKPDETKYGPDCGKLWERNPELVCRMKRPFPGFGGMTLKMSLAGSLGLAAYCSDLLKDWVMAATRPG
jgi:hypothetical protein